jgi:glycosyltransferase involved in cell wall biosynthesis
MLTTSLLCILNIPSPYRLHELEHLGRELQARNIVLDVRFMDVTEPGRYWPFESEKWSFTHKVAPGLRLYVRSIPLLFNPGLVADVWRCPPRWLLLGGSWQIPTVLLLSLLVPLRSQTTRLLLWSESTLDCWQVLSHGVGWAFKRWAFGRYNGFVVPGQKAAQYVRSLAPEKIPILHLPNVVDERLYRDRVHELRVDERALRLRYGLDESEVVFLWPARLVPVKGILNFFSAIAGLDTGSYTILLAGEGPQRAEIEAWQAATGFDHLRLLGHYDETAMLELYALADGLLLPSLSEAFGFAVIEGLWAGLPALISDRVGAWPETVEAGRNGWVVDPTQPQQTRAAFTQAVALGREGLRQMGQASLAIAQERFQTGLAVQQFVNQLLSLG